MLVRAGDRAEPASCDRESREVGKSLGKLEERARDAARVNLRFRFLVQACRQHPPGLAWRSASHERCKT